MYVIFQQQAKVHQIFYHVKFHPLHHLVTNAEENCEKLVNHIEQTKNINERMEEKLTLGFH
jgi:hypothetical protein